MVRYIAIGASAALLAFGALLLEAPDARIAFGLVALTISISLTSLGTLLGRVPDAEGYTMAAGIIGGFDAIRSLAGGSDPHGMIVEILFLAASAVAFVSGLILRRAAKTQADRSSD
jgi:hypothetical protein